MKILRAMPLAVAALACATAGAADLDYALKLRGVAGTASKDGVRNGLAFGFNLGFGLTKDSKVEVELGYRYLTGDGLNVAIPANSLGSTLANQDLPLTSQPGASTNFQKLNIQGFSLRGLYRQNLQVQGLSWHAGLAVNFMKSRMDAIADFRAASPAQTAAGSWAMTPEKQGVTVAPLAGIGYEFNEAGAIEFNVILDSYKQVTVDPVFNATATPANTRVTPSVGSKNVSTPKIELGYTFRF